MTREFDRLAALVPADLPVLIAGPTASGKSDLAMRIAAHRGGTVVNADALQVFGCWRVLTARPSADDEAALPHALYGHIGAQESYSAGHWLREVAPLLRAPTPPVIVGGTGLNFAALTQGLAEIPATPPEVRAEADLRPLPALLADLDATTAARIDRANRARVQRAWEVWRATGRGLAAWQDDTGPPVLPQGAAHALVLRPGGAWLDDRIARRFDRMLEDGALEEARAMLPGWTPRLPASRAIGAAELIAHLRGQMTLDEARRQAVLASRQYAKRQRTWMRNRMASWAEVRPDAE